ncbi:ALP1-like protein, partial [Tanacetum coccineum]
APEIPFVANGVTYPSEYYLVDGIYHELALLVKTIPEPSNDDHKRILFKQKHESARKDVERPFGVLRKKWAILANTARALRKDKIDTTSKAVVQPDLTNLPERKSCLFLIEGLLEVSANKAAFLDG